MDQARCIREYVDRNFAVLGRNKRQQVVRLLYEIAKREKRDFKEIIHEIPQHPPQFQHLKQYLIKRRFPGLTAQEHRMCDCLPELNIDPQNSVCLQEQHGIQPGHFYIEESALGTALVKRLKAKFPEAQYTVIPSYSEFIATKKYSTMDYNHRRSAFFIVHEKCDFFKQCPCSPGCVSCGYCIMNLGSGCAFECVYCFLQNYTNSPGIVIPANIEDFFRQFQKYNKDVRLGSGEFTDSLALDHITEYSPLIVEFFRQYPRSRFEFKTKSSNIQTLLSVKPAENILVSWTLNPQTVIDRAEFYTASLTERLGAARQCVDAGYRAAFHFDPIIYYQGWERDYKELVNHLFRAIDEKYILWISLGGLRMPVPLKKVIENRFPENTLLDGELLPGFDGKLRYSRRVRKEIFSKMKEWIRKESRDVPVYLCMEDREMCGACGIYPEFPIRY